MDRALEEAPTAPLLDGRYRLGECIGQGGMGQVYRAEDVVLGRTVAVKIVKAMTDVANAPERVRNEVKLLAAVQHPSLVTLLDAHIDDPGSSYLVMEYVDGPSLARRLRGGALTELEVATLALDLSTGLDAVHAAGVVHRDLTPGNILLAEAALPRVPFRAKLADFGVAFLIDSTRLTTPGMVVGTAAYLAPEQVRGDAAAPPADIYALGLVLLEALTGERAYPHASGIGAVMARLVEPPKIPAGVSAQWRELLTRMTSSEPADRPTAGEVATIAAELRRTARPVPVASPVPAAASGAAFVPVETQPMPSIAVARPVPVVGHRAALRRTRVRGQRLRRTALLVGSAALVAGLAVPAGLWASAGHSDEPSLIATVPEVEAPDPIVPAEVDSGGVDVLPASSSDGAGDSSQETHDGSKEARDAEKQARDAEKQAREQERDAEKQTREKDDGEKKHDASERKHGKGDREGGKSPKGKRDR